MRVRRSLCLWAGILFAASAVRHRSESDSEFEDSLPVDVERVHCSCSGELGLTCPCSGSAIQLSQRQKHRATRFKHRQKVRAHKMRRRDAKREPDGNEGGEEPAKAETADAEEDQCVEEGLTHTQNVWMQIGPLGMFVGFLLALVLYVEFVEVVAPPVENSRIAEVPDGAAAVIMKQLWGMGAVSSGINALIIVLGLLNFYTYAVSTEEEQVVSFGQCPKSTRPTSALGCLWTTLGSAWRSSPSLCFRSSPLHAWLWCTRILIGVTLDSPQVLDTLCAISTWSWRSWRWL